VRRPGEKAKYVCLPRQLARAKSNYPKNDMDTHREELHVVSLLQQTSVGWMSREAVVESLEKTFDSMRTPFRRSKVFEKWLLEWCLCFGKELFYAGRRV